MTDTVFDEAIEAARTFFQNTAINRKSVLKRSKARPIVIQRKFVAAYLRARDPRHWSYPNIASRLGQKDHTTAIHYIRHAHELWGETLFVKLAAIRPVGAGDDEETPQVIHKAPSLTEIQAVGICNLWRFKNAEDWNEVAA